MPFYTYRCPAGHVREALRSRNDEIIVCPCGEASRRDEVNRIGVTGFAVVPHDQRSYRKSFSQYKEAFDQVDYDYGRAEANGDPIQYPDLFGAAKQQAQKMGA